MIVFVLGGTLLQTFLIEKGFSEENVTVLLSVLQVIQILTIFIFSSIADKFKRYKKATAFSVFASLPLSVFLLILSFSAESGSSSIPFLIFGAFYNIFLGIYNIFSYKLPYTIIDMERYGIITSLVGVVGGGLSFGASVLISYLQTVFTFFAVMRVIYVLTLIFIIGMAVVTLIFDENIPPLELEEEKKKINILKYKPFLILIIPNVFRGFCTGIAGMAATIGYFIGVLDSTSASVLLAVTNISAIASSFLYSFLTRKIREKHMLLTASIMVFVFMSLMTVIKGTASFVTFFGLAYFFVYIVSLSVPVSITRTIKYDVIGQYTGGRILLHTLGSSLAGFLCIPMIKLFGAELTMIISGGLQLVSGIVYYVFLNDYEKQNNIKV
jgi:MFS family permease